MFNKSIQFEFTGFEPEYEVHKFISTIADSIQSEAPSDSFMKVAMTKGRDTIKASCRIASQVGTFAAEAVCSNPKTAIRQIENKIKKQLNHWKMVRFDHRSRSAEHVM